MPESMSLERRMMLLALGARVVLTPAATAVNGAIAKRMPMQFENPSKPKVHRETPGDMEGHGRGG